MTRPELPSPVSPRRRQFLGAAGLGAFGGFWRDWSVAHASGAVQRRASARAVILIWQLVGESDRIGAHPKDRPLVPTDVHATLFTALGYDPHGATFLSADGRPFPLSEGQVIRGLL